MRVFCTANCQTDITCCCCNVQFSCMCSLHQHFVRDNNAMKYLIDLVSCTAKLFEDCDCQVKGNPEIIEEVTGLKKQDLRFNYQFAFVMDEQSNNIKNDKLSTKFGTTESMLLPEDSGPEDSVKETADKNECINSKLPSKCGQQIEQTGKCVNDDDASESDFNVQQAHRSDIIGRDIFSSHHNNVNSTLKMHVEKVKNRNQPKGGHVVNKAKIPCDVCGHMYKKRDLKQHKKIHTDTKVFRCEVCQKVFKTASCLYGHQLHHRTEKDHICQYCGKQFNNWPNLRQHIKTHTRERTLQCPLCPKMFRSNYVLKDHISRHSDEKPFSCTGCSRSFKKSQELKRHMMTFHTEARDHMCKVCHKTFKSKSNHVKHEKIHDRKGKS